MFYKYGYIISVTLLTVNTFFEKIFADEGQMDRKPSGPAGEPSACTQKNGGWRTCCAPHPSEYIQEKQSPEQADAPDPKDPSFSAGPLVRRFVNVSLLSSSGFCRAVLLRARPHPWPVRRGRRLRRRRSIRPHRYGWLISGRIPVCSGHSR